jgi:hypothetical protein
VAPFLGLTVALRRTAENRGVEDLGLFSVSPSTQSLGIVLGISSEEKGLKLSCCSQTMEYLISLSAWTWVMVVTLTSVAATTAWFAFFGFSNPVTETEMLPEATSSCLPIIGDSAHFLWQGPHRFVANQISRFQEFFKLSILGLDPIIVGTSPEFVKFVLANKSFRPSYPSRLTKLVSGDYNIHSLKRIQIDTLARRCTFGTFSGENLHKHLPFLNSLASQVVDSLQSMGTILNIESEIVKVSSTYSMIVSPLCFFINSIKCLINKIPFKFFQIFSSIFKFFCIYMQQCVIFGCLVLWI